MASDRFYIFGYEHESAAHVQRTLPDMVAEGIKKGPEPFCSPAYSPTYSLVKEKPNTLRAVVLNKMTSHNNVGGLRTNGAFRDRLVEE